MATERYCVQRWGLAEPSQVGPTGTEDLGEGLAVGKFIPLHADTDPHAQGA